MKVYVNEITGIADAIVSMFMSKRTWTRELEINIRDTCDRVLTRHGQLKNTDLLFLDDFDNFTNWLNSLVRWGRKHITMLRFIDISVTVEGLHRAGQDDWDAHAYRFNNRIIRNSTRLATFENEMSEWYQDKIIPTDLALIQLRINTPDIINKDGITFVKTINGYIREDLKDNKDAKRGLYMLSIPSNFIFKINLTEYGHVYKERNILGNANPEVKICCESITDQIEGFHKQFNRELFNKIKN